MNRSRIAIVFRSPLCVLLLGTFSGNETELKAQAVAQPVADAGMSDALRKVMESNCQANEKENLDDALATIHPQSPTHETTRQISSKLFEAFDLKYELKSFRYIGSDETYAVGRARIRASSSNPANFRNNETDLMVVFRKENDSWKIWSQSILEIKLD